MIITVLTIKIRTYHKMYLLVIAVILLLLYLLLGGFSNIESKRVVGFVKNVRWYVFSALCLLLGLWFTFSGKTYLSWVMFVGLLPALKRLLLGVLYFWGANKVRKLITGATSTSPPPVPMNLTRAEQLLKVSADMPESKIIDAYLARKKDCAKNYQDDPELKAQKIRELEVARDYLLRKK